MHNVASWVAYEPLCSKMLPERIRPVYNEVGALTDEAVAVREAFQNLEVQSRGIMIVEGQSHSVFTEMAKFEATILPRHFDLSIFSWSECGCVEQSIAAGALRDSEHSSCNWRQQLQGLSELWY